MIVSGNGGRRLEICHSPVAKLRETIPTYLLPSFNSRITLIACCSQVSSFFSSVERASFIRWRRFQTKLSRPPPPKHLQTCAAARSRSHIYDRSFSAGLLARILMLRFRNNGSAKLEPPRGAKRLRSKTRDDTDCSSSWIVVVTSSPCCMKLSENFEMEYGAFSALKAVFGVS
jgi:hypothetical protein